jgi:uncharacterized protein YjiS (DUF1127 family)
MTDMIETLGRSDRSEFLWFLETTCESAIRATRYFFTLMRDAAARERTRKEIASLDARMLHDIGLEPFDVRYGWRNSH